MKVLFLTHRLPYAPNRGDRIRAYHLLREMSGFAEVSLFSLVHDDDEAAQVTDLPFAKAVVTSRVSRMANFARASARLLSDRPLTHSLLDASDVSQKLSRLVESNRPDVVLAYCSGMARFAIEPPLDRLPFVLDMVDVDSAKWHQLATRASGPRRWVYQREATTLAAFEAAVATRAATTLVVNDREYHALQRIAPESRIRVVQNGIDIDAFRAPGSTVRSPAVVFCGVLNYGPNESGLIWFLDAVWPLVRSARPDARFRIVGAHPTNALQQASARDASVDLVGAVPSVQPYLWQSAVSVAPLHLARGLQNKVLEALAAGLPVVATPVVLNGLPPEALPGCVEADGADEFARAVVALLEQTPVARAAKVATADLARLGWSERLREVEGVLRGAAGPDVAGNPNIGSNDRASAVTP